MNNLARKLRQWRHDFGLTQEQAAGWAGYSLSQYGRFERSHRAPPQNHWQRLDQVVDAFYAAAWIERDRGAHL
jgi:transcriptional regulator with XRE-family HTH domain